MRGEWTWTSPQSNIAYDLDWTIELADGHTLNVCFIAEDQEFFEPTRAALTFAGAIALVGEAEEGEKIMDLVRSRSYQTASSVPGLCKLQRLRV